MASFAEMAAGAVARCCQSNLAGGAPGVPARLDGRGARPSIVGFITLHGERKKVTDPAYGVVLPEA